MNIIEQIEFLDQYIKSLEQLRDRIDKISKDMALTKETAKRIQKFREVRKSLRKLALMKDNAELEKAVA